MAGKLKGVTAAKTPSGWRTYSQSIPAATSSSDFPGARQRHAAELLARGGIRDVQVTGGGGTDPVTADIVAQGFHPLSLGTAKGLSTHELGLLGRSLERDGRAAAAVHDLRDFIEVSHTHEFLVLHRFVALVLGSEFP